MLGHQLQVEVLIVLIGSLIFHKDTALLSIARMEEQSEGVRASGDARVTGGKSTAWGLRRAGAEAPLHFGAGPRIVLRDQSEVRAWDPPYEEDEEGHEQEWRDVNGLLIERLVRASSSSGQKAGAGLGS